MAYYKVTDTALTGVASAIRAKGGTSTPLEWPDGFVSAVGGISASAVLGSKTISSNGSYSAAADNLDGFDNVVVNVSGGFSPADEGKVVQSGALVSQTSQNISANGTYDTTTKNQVVVNVSGGGNNVIVLDTQYDSEHIYLGGTDPSDSDGNDGDYYYCRNKTNYGTKVLESEWNGSSTTHSGWQFEVTESLQVTALRGRIRSSGTCQLYLYDKTDPNDIIIIAQSGEMEMVPGWNDYVLPAAVVLSPNHTYMVVLKSKSLSYTKIRSGGFNAKLTNIVGVYGSYNDQIPHSADSTNAYSADIVIDSDQYNIEKSYRKSSGTWVAI